MLLLLAEGPGQDCAPQPDDSRLLLQPETFRCTGWAGLAFDLPATSMKSPKVAALGWGPPFPRVGALGSSAGRSSRWRPEEQIRNSRAIDPWSYATRIPTYSSVGFLPHGDMVL